DDFAHHPTAIETTIAGLRSRMEAGRLAQGDAGIRQRPGRLLAVVEPRSNTMKLGAMKALLADSLAGADLIYCHGAGLGWDAAQVLASLGLRARTFDDIDAIVQAVAQDARDGDHVLVMSNGGFGGIHGKLLAALAAGPASGAHPPVAGASASTAPAASGDIDANVVFAASPQAGEAGGAPAAGKLPTAH